VALPACQAALAAAPENPRLLFQMGLEAEAMKDDFKARSLYEKAAQRGYGVAQGQLAMFYMNGQGGLTKSDQEAARLLKHAADQGVAFAQSWLGTFYRDGRGGLAKNDQEAARLFMLAAKQGHDGGLTNLGYFYEYGRGGIPKDEQEAARLYRLAADQGNADAQAFLSRLPESAGSAGRTMSPPTLSPDRMVCPFSEHRSTAPNAHARRCGPIPSRLRKRRWNAEYRRGDNG
jgi:TPR repeat protein